MGPKVICVLIQKANLDRETDLHADAGGRQYLQAKKHLRLLLQKLGDRQRIDSLSQPQPCRCLDFRFLASKTVRQ